MESNTLPTEHFVLKEDGKIYWIDTMPDSYYYVQNAQGWRAAVLSAISNAVEVSNQEEARQALLKALNWNPDPSEHRFDIGVPYSLQCSVDILPWSTLRIYSSGDAHKYMPVHGNGALVTLSQPEREETQDELLPLNFVRSITGWAKEDIKIRYEKWKQTRKTP